MGAPRQPLNATTHSVGYTAKVVTVTSVSGDGKTAIVTDRQNTQQQVSMLVQRSKATLPKPGEAWVITQDLGSWNFAAFVATSAADFATSGGGSNITVGGQPPVNPGEGDVWLNSANGNAVFTWSGTIWVAAPFGSGALAPQAVTRGIIALGAVTTAQIAPDAGIKASQVAFRAGEIGGSRIFTLTYAPTGMTPGDLWFNPAQGNTVSVWNGNQWIPLLFGAPAILPGSLTTLQLSDLAGIVASQVSFTAADIGGITTSISSTQPSAPSVNDLWYDAAAGYQLRQWNGVAWVPYKWGTQAIAAGAVTADLIAANTITAAELAAGIVYAGIIDGTIVEAAIFLGSVFQGTNWIENSDGMFLYSASPAQGNLAISVAPAGGNDAAWTSGTGNDFPDGIQVINTGGSAGSYTRISSGGLIINNVHNAGGGFLPTTTITIGPTPSGDQVVVSSAAAGGGSGLLQFTCPVDFTGPVSAGDVTASSLETGTVLTLDPQGSAPAAPASGARAYSDGAGFARAINSADNQIHALGHRIVQNTAGTAVNTGGAYSQVASSGQLGVGTYQVHGQISYSTVVGSPTGSPRVRFDSGTATQGHARGAFYNAGVPAVIDKVLASSDTFAGNTLAAGEQFMEFDFIVPVTAAGTFLVICASTGSSYTVNFVNLRIDPL